MQTKSAKLEHTSTQFCDIFNLNQRFEQYTFAFYFHKKIEPSTGQNWIVSDDDINSEHHLWI